MSEIAPIPLRDADLRNIVDSVLGTFVATRPAALARPHDPPAPDREIWTGCVTVEGEFAGAVTLTATPAFAHCMARAMFADAGLVSDDSARDALAEITNIVGGNIKCLLSDLVASTCRLSVPLVSTGRLKIPGGVLLKELWSECGGHRLCVAVYRAPPAPSPQ